MKVATTALLSGLAILLVSGSGVAPHGEVGPVIDNPLGEATVLNLGPFGSGNLFRIYFDITHTGSACTQSLACGEYAFKLITEVPLGGLAISTTSYSPQLNALRDSGELNSVAPGVGGLIDPFVNGYAGNVCGGSKNGVALADDGPTSAEPDGNVWIDVTAGAGTTVFVGAIYETTRNQANGLGGTCNIGDPNQPSNFPGRYTGVSFSETIALV